MKNIYKLFPFLIAVLMFNCEQDDSTNLSNFVGFEIGPNSYELVKDLTETVEIQVAASEKTNSDRTYTVLVDPTSDLAAAYSIPSTVTIPANSNIGILPITVTEDDNLSFAPQKLVLNFQKEAGTDFGTPLTLNFVEQCLETKVNLAIDLDDWSEETAWELYDLSGTPTLIDSRPYGTYASAPDYSTVSIDFCLSSGPYGLIVFDAYGDGIINEAGTAYRGFRVSVGGTVIAQSIVGNSGAAGTTPTQAVVTFTID